MVGFKIQLPSCVLDIIANCTSLQFYQLSFKGKPARQTRQAVIYILIGRCSLCTAAIVVLLLLMPPK